MIVNEKVAGVVTVKGGDEVKVPVTMDLKDRVIESMEKRSSW